LKRLAELSCTFLLSVGAHPPVITTRLEVVEDGGRRRDLITHRHHRVAEVSRSRHFDPIALRLRHPAPAEVDLPGSAGGDFDRTLVLRRTEFGQRGHLIYYNLPIAADIGFVVSPYFITFTRLSIDLRRAAGDADFSILAFITRIYARLGLAADVG